jgi:hypothetical protein
LFRVLTPIRRETGCRWAFRKRPRLVIVVVLLPTAVKPAIMVLPRFPALPVTGIVTMFIIAGGHPIGPSIRWTRPETRMPSEPRANRVIVARNPRVLRTRTRRRVHDYRGRRRCVIVRRPEADPDRPMSLGKQRPSGEQHECEQLRLPVPVPPLLVPSLEGNSGAMR